MIQDAQFEGRSPALALAELTLPSGESANKHSLLSALSESGLPVPPLIDSFKESARAFTWRRGFLKNGAVDNWAVDILPSGEVSPSSDEEFQRRIEGTLLNDRVRRYLEVNFGVVSPEADSFLQRALDSDFYYSTWRYDEFIFVCFAKRHSSSGNDACFTVDGDFVEGSSGIFSVVKNMLREELLPLEDDVTKALNGHLGNDLCYKVDYLGKGLKFSVIQARVASRPLSATEQSDRISALKQEGVPVIECEVGAINRLETGSPFILHLKNSEHIGTLPLDKILDMDLRNMKGMILPRYLKGGLLRHHGYIFLAYALYWGLPVSFR